jgi:hypothetical protein
MATNALPAASLKPGAEDESYNMALQQLMSTLESRQNRGYNPNLLAIAEGMLTPTATGSFGEGIGQAAKAVRGVQEQEARREQDNAMMRFQLAKENMGIQEKRRKQDLMGQLYKETPQGFVLDTEKAKELARVTGDPQYIQQIIASEKQNKMRLIGEQMFTPKTIETDGVKKTTYEFNPSAVFDLAKISDNPVEAVAKYAEMVPKLRKAGMLGGEITDATPFDAIAIMANDPSINPAIKLQAQNLAKKYSKGLIDEDKANTLAQQMLTMMTSHMDRQQAMKFTQAMQGMMLGLRQDQTSFNQLMQTQKVQDKKQSEADEKIKAATDVDELLTSMKASYDNLKELGSMKSTSEGMLGNLAASAKTSGLGQAIGRSFGTKTQSEINDIETMKPLLLQSIKNATGMSSAQMNSNAELKFYLNAATDPTKGYEENIKAIQRLQKMYGLSSLPKRIKPSDQPELSPDQNKKPPSDQPVLRWNPATKSFE